MATTGLSALGKRMLGPAGRFVLGALGSLEDKILPDYELCHGPVFIVGLPRSGTTLLYQLTTYALTTSYFTNLALRLRVQGIVRPPAVFAAWLGSLLRLPEHRRETFRSSHGITRGLGNPSDSVMIWQHWFPNRYVDAGELTADARHAIYQIVSGTEKMFGQPFVDKCTHHSIRIRALVEIFPTALFVHCTRNPLAVAQSLYLASIRPGIEPPEERWDSTRPRGFELLWHLGMVERVCKQVYLIEQEIRKGLAFVLPQGIVKVDYSDICQAPQRVVENVASLMDRNGVRTTQVRSVPAQFACSSVRRIDTATYQTMIDRLEGLFGHKMQRLDEPK